jgi:hypothetical protein
MKEQDPFRLQRTQIEEAKYAEFLAYQESKAKKERVLEIHEQVDPKMGKIAVQLGDKIDNALTPALTLGFENREVKTEIIEDTHETAEATIGYYAVGPTEIALEKQGPDIKHLNQEDIALASR